MGTRSRGKDVVLLVLAVTTLVVAFYTFRGHSAPTPAPAAAQPGAAQATVPGQPKVRAAVDPKALMPAINGSRNPFTAPPGAPPIRLASTKKHGEVEEQEGGVSQVRVTRPAPTMPPPLPTFAPVAQAPAAGTVQPAGVAPTPAPAPEFRPKLAGIMVDAAGRPTAVIHEGEQRYFARAGDTIAGKYKVQSIGNQQVVLVAARERLILKMGGS